MHIDEAAVASPFTEPASPERLHNVARALEANGFTTHVVDTAEDARRAVLDLIPLGSVVHTGASVTLDTLGLNVEFESGRYDAVRPKYYKLDRRTQMPETRKLVSTPQFMLASVGAVTESGSLVLASNTGVQMAGVVFGADNVILVVGAQKVVRDLDDALRRIEDYCLPLESQRTERVYGQPSNISKLLILNKEVPLKGGTPGRIHVVLVGDPLGY